MNGKKVSFQWETAGTTTTGTGEVISEEDHRGRVLVALDPPYPEARHFVILCAASWLTEVPEERQAYLAGSDQTWDGRQETAENPPIGSTPPAP